MRWGRLFCYGLCGLSSPVPVGWPGPGQGGAGPGVGIIQCQTRSREGLPEPRDSRAGCSRLALQPALPWSRWLLQPRGRVACGIVWGGNPTASSLWCQCYCQTHKCAGRGRAGWAYGHTCWTRAPTLPASPGARARGGAALPGHGGWAPALDFLQSEAGAGGREGSPSPRLWEARLPEASWAVPLPQPLPLSSLMLWAFLGCLQPAPGPAGCCAPGPVGAGGHREPPGTVLPSQDSSSWEHGWAECAPPPGQGVFLEPLKPKSPWVVAGGGSGGCAPARPLCEWRLQEGARRAGVSPAAMGDACLCLRVADVQSRAWVLGPRPHVSVCVSVCECEWWAPCQDPAPEPAVSTGRQRRAPSRPCMPRGCPQPVPRSAVAVPSTPTLCHRRRFSFTHFRPSPSGFPLGLVTYLSGFLEVLLSVRPWVVSWMSFRKRLFYMSCHGVCSNKSFCHMAKMLASAALAWVRRCGGLGWGLPSPPTGDAAMPGPSRQGAAQARTRPRNFTRFSPKKEIASFELFKGDQNRPQAVLWTRSGPGSGCPAAAPSDSLTLSVASEHL